MRHGDRAGLKFEGWACWRGGLVAAWRRTRITSQQQSRQRRRSRPGVSAHGHPLLAQQQHLLPPATPACSVLPTPNAGDGLIVMDAGAYCMSMARWAHKTNIAHPCQPLPPCLWEISRPACPWPGAAVLLGHAMQTVCLVVGAAFPILTWQPGAWDLPVPSAPPPAPSAPHVSHPERVLSFPVPAATTT